MNKEFVYWVDRNNRLRGKVSREEAHDKVLLHRIAQVLVFNTQGKLFMQRRSLKFRINPGLWTGSCVGHVDYGESYHTTAVRELREEIGIRAKKLKELLTFQMNDSGCNKIAKVFMLENFSGTVKIDHDEVIDGKWLSLGEIEKKLKQTPTKFTPGFRKVFKKYLQYKIK